MWGWVQPWSVLGFPRGRFPGGLNLGAVVMTWMGLWWEMVRLTGQLKLLNLYWKGGMMHTRFSWPTELLPCCSDQHPLAPCTDTTSGQRYQSAERNLNRVELIFRHSGGKIRTSKRSKPSGATYVTTQREDKNSYQVRESGWETWKILVSLMVQSRHQDFTIQTWLLEASGETDLTSGWYQRLPARPDDTK